MKDEARARAFTRSDVNLRGGDINLRGGNLNLRGGETNLRGTPANLGGSNQNLRGGDPTLRGTPPLFRGGETNLRGIPSIRATILDLFPVTHPRHPAEHRQRKESADDHRGAEDVQARARQADRVVA